MEPLNIIIGSIGNTPISAPELAHGMLCLENTIRDQKGSSRNLSNRSKLHECLEPSFQTKKGSIVLRSLYESLHIKPLTQISEQNGIGNHHMWINWPHGQE